MYTRLFNTWENFRASFWFVPAILMVAASIGAYLMVRLDWYVDSAIVKAFPMFEMSPPAARSILSSIVGALVSATGVVFSMTIVALSLASSQFGSRLIRTYRGRRSTHFTLGIFVSTSLYCILVLTCIREVNDFDFVPTLAVAVAILLTVVCLSTLIYYIHDMSYAIQASSVIDQSAEDLHLSIGRLFPKKLGDDIDSDASDKMNVDQSSLESAAANIGAPTWTVKCNQVGYVQAIENESIMNLTMKHKIVVRLLLRPGDFIHDGCPLAHVYFATDHESSGDGEDAEMETSIDDELSSSLIIGNDRTPTQDVRYAFNELVEVAVRALSPGINDPFTAINCVDRITAALHELRNRGTPSEFRVDEEGILRVIAEPVPFEECLDISLGVIKHYAEGSPMVKTRVSNAIERLADLSPLQ